MSTAAIIVAAGKGIRAGGNIPKQYSKLLGLPVLTCLGQAFAGRVAASLLTAVGLPELITHDLAAYEARALELARDTAQLAALKQRLNEQRVQAPLFDTPRFTRDLEAAYAHMVQRHRQGLAPAPFAVAELNA